MPNRLFIETAIVTGHKNGLNIFASAARTATPTAAEFVTEGARALQIVLNVTAVTSSPSVVFTVSGKSASGIYYTLLASAAIVGTGTTVLNIGPEITAATNTAANLYIPETIRISPVHGNANSITYTVDCELIA